MPMPEDVPDRMPEVGLRWWQIWGVSVTMQNALEKLQDVSLATKHTAH